jgi:hypothetical protein
MVREAPPRDYEVDRPRYEDEPAYEDEDELPEPNPY